MEMKDFHPLTTLSSSYHDVGESSSFQITEQKPHPRKKQRTKIVRMDDDINKKPKQQHTSSRKPDPAAPKITRPCTECGKKFWSWKALFGHMRCHPERQWRGINPPPNLSRRRSSLLTNDQDSSAVTEEDHEVATCLLLLANAGAAAASDHSPSAPTVNQEMPQYSDDYGRVSATPYLQNSTMVDDQGHVDHLSNTNNNRFECSSCKKVFGSHQALGGHRASHKNVKGCYAITTKNGQRDDHHDQWCSGGDHKWEKTTTNMMMMELGHKCSICLRVFSSGQALGGHKRCHWENNNNKEDDDDPPMSSSCCRDDDVSGGRRGFDLNVPLDQDHGDIASSSSYYTNNASSHSHSHDHLALDLRLGL
ncbi:hypothetical protein BUALT_Bualt19G0130400 [Buddleja alternifolia]|uniref:C2H2-type domain-containing protein n=1 Tax=Buddleja alternifolia TaxID=168488 RepID=A0AAV6W2I2_9LAMI|nr:hypothetical protein BUALT_Bualt19G0130400 [Buddleja alternifolia]